MLPAMSTSSLDPTWLVDLQAPVKSFRLFALERAMAMPPSAELLAALEAHRTTEDDEECQLLLIHAIGAIRQRFLYFSYFHLDLTNVSGASPQDIADLKKLFIPCIPQGPQPIKDDTLRKFTEGLAQLEAKYGTTPGTPALTSQFQDGFLYQGGQTGATPPTAAAFAAPKPAFFDYRDQSILVETSDPI